MLSCCAYLSLYSLVSLSKAREGILFAPCINSSYFFISLSLLKNEDVLKVAGGEKKLI